MTDLTSRQHYDNAVRARNAASQLTRDGVRNEHPQVRALVADATLEALLSLAARELGR